MVPTRICIPLRKGIPAVTFVMHQSVQYLGGSMRKVAVQVDHARQPPYSANQGRFLPLTVTAFPDFGGSHLISPRLQSIHT
jgi:hypothetical protein